LLITYFIPLLPCRHIGAIFGGCKSSGEGGLSYTEMSANFPKTPSESSLLTLSGVNDVLGLLDCKNYICCKCAFINVIQR